MEPDDPRLELLRKSLSKQEYNELVAMLKSRRDLAPAGPKPLKPAPAKRAAKRPANKRRTFGQTWWGKAWVDALEQKARLDPNRLPRGRTYARQSRVLRLDLEPHEVSAFVQGSRARPYRVQLHVRPFKTEEWDRLLDAIAGKAAHAAALLDGELEPGILDDAERVGVDLLPGPGDLSPSCNCPDWADPCKHSAAVCYLVADELDKDPFGLLLLRGMPRNEVLAAVRKRRRSDTERGGKAKGVTDASVGVLARELYAAERPNVDAVTLAQLGHVAVGPARGTPAPLPVDPPSATGIRADDLVSLAADAARRATAMLLDGAASGLSDPPEIDLVRRAAATTYDPAIEGQGHAERQRIALRSGRSMADLSRDLTAWKLGGLEGLAVVHDRWFPERDQLEEGREALGSGVRATANRLTRGDIQLRLAPSGRWYRFHKDPDWELLGPGAPDPHDLL